MKYIIYTILFITLVKQAICNPLIQSQTQSWDKQIILPEGIVLKWMLSDEERITMQLSGPTRGYLGIGFSPAGGMTGSDMILGWVDNNGTGQILDLHGLSNGTPVIDKQQDVELLDAHENEQGTSLTFRRKWQTCDDHDKEITEDTVRLIWAWSENDPLLDRFHWHGPGVGRGVRSVFIKNPENLKSFPDQASVLDPNIKWLDVKMPNFTVPRIQTLYHCKILKLPKFNGKVHMIGYRPLIKPENAPYIHHINIYRCHVPEALGKTSDTFEQYLEHPGADCLSFSSPRDWKEFCYAFMVVTAAGEEGHMYPSHLGDPFGYDDGRDTYVKLEVHYDSTYSVDLIDSSGIRVFYTEYLRPYDLSMLFVGHRRTPFLSIPPHQSNFKISGHCSPDCTSMGFPPSGIKIVSVLLHAHLRGRKITLRHIRQGKELRPIAYDNHYDFNYQVYRSVPEINVLPGDELVVECDYDTAQNDTFILGGLSTRREMCEAFVLYYPKANLVDCRSQPEYYSYLSALSIKNATGAMLQKLHLPYDPEKFKESGNSLGLPDDVFVLADDDLESSIFFSSLNITNPLVDASNLAEYMENLNWRNRKFASKVEKIWSNGPHYMHCAVQHGIRLENPYLSKISNYKPFPMEKTQCS